MKPFINIVRLSELSSKQRNKICECKSPCDKGISLTTYNDGIIMCWNDARRTFFNLINLLDEDTKTTWTANEEEYVIQYYQDKGVYYGINGDLAEQLGKSYAQVKSKVRRLREQGRL